MFFFHHNPPRSTHSHWKLLCNDAEGDLGSVNNVAINQTGLSMRKQIKEETTMLVNMLSSF